MIRNIKRLFVFLTIAIAVILLSSCVKSYSEDEIYDRFVNYDVLWNTLDERYCYFEYKNINWDSLYTAYRQRLSLARGTEAVFNIYSGLMAHLKDGHVNLNSAGDYGRYWEWKDAHPSNFSQDVLSEHYLKDDFKIAAGFWYKILDNIGYIRYESFSSGIGDGNISAVFDHFKECDGLIIDVRSNGGGILTNAEKIAARFTRKNFKYGYLQHKIGKGHSDFSEPEPQYLYSKSETHTIWEKPVVVLTNRGCYSATNTFVSIMKQLDNVTIMGDQTGGGGGLPVSSELPIGWVFRYSAVPMLDENFKHIENGILPDIELSLNLNLLKDGKDSMIEDAISFLKQK